MISFELDSSMETLLALSSCSPGLNPIYCGMPLVENFVLIEFRYLNAFMNKILPITLYFFCSQGC